MHRQLAITPQWEKTGRFLLLLALLPLLGNVQWRSTVNIVRGRGMRGDKRSQTGFESRMLRLAHMECALHCREPKAPPLERIKDRFSNLILFLNNYPISGVGL